LVLRKTTYTFLDHLVKIRLKMLALDVHVLGDDYMVFETTKI
jgi:hypothetical protein